MDNDLVYCNDIKGLILTMGMNYDPNEWRLFIDSSKRSLKAVLLYIGNSMSSIPVAHSVLLQENYVTMKLLIEKLKYEEHKWLICGYLKVITLLLGQQGGYTKDPCFLCLWDSRADSQHYSRHEWPTRTEFIPGKDNVRSNPLVDPHMVFYCHHSISNLV